MGGKSVDMRNGRPVDVGKSNRMAVVVGGGGSSQTFRKTNVEFHTKTRSLRT